MKITDLKQTVDEVAMNPGAYAQSIEQGQKQGVLVGFEFEVCVPADVFNPKTTDAANNGGITHREVDSLLDHADSLDFGLYQLDYQLDKMAQFDELFTPKANKTRYNSLTDAYNALLAKRTEQAKELFYQIPESVRAEFVSKAQDVVKNRINDAGSMEPLVFARVFANQVRYGLSGTKIRGYRPVLEKLADIEFSVDEVFKLMCVGDRYGAPEKISKYFDYDPEAVYEAYDLAEYDDDGDNDYEDYPGYDKASKAIAPVLKDTMGSQVKIFSDRHQDTKKLDRWYIEPDGSLDPNEQEDACVEIVGPPEAPNQALNSLKKFFGMAQQLKFYTNKTTGLHINVSIPQDIDVLKLAVFTGDQYVLQQYGRLENDYSRSVTRAISKTPDSKLSKALPQTKSGTGKNVFGQRKLSRDLQVKLIQKIAADISDSHTASISSENDKYISFRHTGGDYLTDYQGIVNVVGRFVRAMVIASDPNAYRNEYLAAVAKLAAPAVAPTGGDADIDKVRQEGIAMATIYLARPPGFYSSKFNNIFNNLPSVFKSPNSSVIGTIEPNSEEAKKDITSTVKSDSWKRMFGSEAVSNYAQVVTKAANFKASETYKAMDNKGVNSTYNGYYLVKVEMIPPTDPYVQQIILNMRKAKLKK